MVMDVPITKGAIVIIDEEDGPRVTKRRWQLSAAGYAITQFQVNGKSRTVSMHRFVMNAQHGMAVDHINGNRLDNRKLNLRVITNAENCQNLHGARSDSSTGIRGVFWSKKERRYRVRIWVRGKPISCGYFATLAEADAAAREARSRMMTHSTI